MVQFQGQKYEKKKPFATTDISLYKYTGLNNVSNNWTLNQNFKTRDIRLPYDRHSNRLVVGKLTKGKTVICCMQL